MVVVVVVVVFGFDDERGRSICGASTSSPFHASTTACIMRALHGHTHTRAHLEKAAHNVVACSLLLLLLHPLPLWPRLQRPPRWGLPTVIPSQLALAPPAATAAAAHGWLARMGVRVGCL